MIISALIAHTALPVTKITIKKVMAENKDINNKSAVKILLMLELLFLDKEIPIKKLFFIFAYFTCNI